MGNAHFLAIQKSKTGSKAYILAVETLTLLDGAETAVNVATMLEEILSMNENKFKIICMWTTNHWWNLYILQNLSRTDI